MRITIGLAQVGEDVYVAAGRDEQDVRCSMAVALKGLRIEGLTVASVKVGKVYKNLAEMVPIHGEICH